MLTPISGGLGAVSYETAYICHRTAQASEIDELGHVNNTVYVKWVQDMAIQHWNTIIPTDLKAAYLSIILRHEIENMVFYSLYGHLSLGSLEGLVIGNTFKQGDVLATLGTPEINVNYAPHLHFQLIQDMEGKKGDYPGVCNENRVAFYAKNCPNPNFLLKITS